MADFDYLDRFSSLDNLMAYGLGTQAKPAAAPTPELPLPGTGASFGDQDLYNSFSEPAPMPQNASPVDGMMQGVLGLMAGKQSPVQGQGILGADSGTAKTLVKGPVLGPGVLPLTIPADVSMTPPSYRPPDGNSMGQVDALRDALFQVESLGQPDPYISKNPKTTASGKYQWINGTWNNYGGYKEARFAPPAVQEARINEDVVQSLRRFNGDPFAVIANHMLPIQARKPWLWTQPSRVRVKGKMVTVPPVIDYVRKAVRGTPYENELKKYMAAYVPR